MIIRTTMTTCTRIEVTRTVGRPRCRLVTGMLVPRQMASPPGVVRIALVASQALLLAGDHVEVSVEVTGDVTVEIWENAATVAYAMRGGSARWDVCGFVADGGRLGWLGQPLVVSHGADVSRNLQLDVESGSRAALRETYVFGRSGETGGTLDSTSRITSDGRPVLAEDLRLDPESRAGWLTLHDARYLDTVTTVGHRLPDAGRVLQADETASIARSMGTDLHHSELEPVWLTAMAGLRGRDRGKEVDEDPALDPPAAQDTTAGGP